MMDKKELQAMLDEAFARSRKSEYLLSVADVAYLLGYEPYSPSADRIIKSSTFPAPASLLPGGAKRWRKADVIEWIDAHFGD